MNQYLISEAHLFFYKDLLISEVLRFEDKGKPSNLREDVKSVQSILDAGPIKEPDLSEPALQAAFEQHDWGRFAMPGMFDKELDGSYFMSQTKYEFEIFKRGVEYMQRGKQ